MLCETDSLWESRSNPPLPALVHCRMATSLHEGGFNLSGGHRAYQAIFPSPQSDPIHPSLGRIKPALPYASDQNPRPQPTAFAVCLNTRPGGGSDARRPPAAECCVEGRRVIHGRFWQNERHQDAKEKGTVQAEARAESLAQRDRLGALHPPLREDGEDREGMLQNAIADALNNTEWAFALAECAHIGGFAVGIGSIALVDFRMLNLGLRHETASRILRYTEPWTLIALAVVVFSGSALFLSQVGIYLVNPIFPFKMYVLGAALLYNFTVHRKVANMESPPPVLTKVVAIVSLLLWVSVVFGGIFTGFLE